MMGVLGITNTEQRYLQIDSSLPFNFCKDIVFILLDKNNTVNIIQRTLPSQILFKNDGFMYIPILSENIDIINNSTMFQIDRDTDISELKLKIERFIKDNNNMAILFPELESNDYLN